MVRSNFDYSNRTSSGEKLGISIAGDFWKVAAQTIKIVKPTTKPTKGGSRKNVPSSDASASVVPSTGPVIATTKIEIKIPDKKLTDDGIRHIAEALTTALRQRPDLAMMELDLSGNELTAKALRGLTEVVKQTQDLQILNLSNNDIAIRTTEECKDWQLFVEAAFSCDTLIRIDFSHNENSGALAWEVFRRALNPGITAHDQRGHSHRNDPFDLDVSGLKIGGQDDSSGEAQASPSQSPHKSVKPSSTGKVIKILQAGLNDHGALFVGSILSRTAATQMPIDVVWADNLSTLTKDGVQLLTLTEKSMRAIKRSACNDEGIDDGSTDDEDVEFEVANIPMGKAARARAVSLSKRHFEEPSGPSEQLERITRKIQRNIINLHGYKSVELWAAGMAALAVSRKIYTLTPRRHEQEAAESVSDVALTEDQVSGEKYATAAAEFGIPLERQRNLKSPDTLPTLLMKDPYTPDPTPSPSPSPSPTKGTKSWAATVASSTPGDYSTDFSSPIPGLGVRHEPVWFKPEVKSTNKLKKLKRQTYYNSDGIAEDTVSGAQASIASPGLASDIARHQTAFNSEDAITREELAVTKEQNYLDWQVKHMRKLQVEQGGASDGYKDKSLRSQLPLTIGLRIMSFAIPEDTLVILSDRQQRKAFEWGQLHDTLSTEYDWRTKDQSSQIWMLLEALECLEYD